jgi:hypothetical protein
MKLPIPFFKKAKKEESEYYLALLLTEEKTSAVILKEHLGKLQVLGKHQEFFSSSLEVADTEELISLIDKTISRAEEVLPPDIQTHKTVFGLKDNWIDTDTKKIKKDYLVKLKKVCDSLDLSPIGFMVLTEAISNLLQEEEGAPLSAILAEIGKKTVALTLFRGGKIAERIDGPIEETISKTVDNLLKHFTTTVLPARIILYDGGESDKLSQQFIGHEWSKSLPFLHVPQIIILPEGTDAKAVAFGAAEQMGFEVLGMNLKTGGIPLPTSDSQPDPDFDKATTGKQDETEQVAEQAKEEKEENSVDEKITSDNFGFVTDQDISTIKPEAPPHVNLDQGENQETEEEDTEEDIKDTIEERENKTKMPNIFSGLSAIHLPKLSWSLGHGKNKHLIFILAVLAGLLILVGGISYFYIASVRANIILSVKPRMVDETGTVIFSSLSSSDFSKNTIATKVITASVKGEITIDTTGKKDVGNKAKGKVTIYNNGNDSVKLNSGDSIKSSNGLVFVLDRDVAIASASGDIFSGTKPGTADVNITAKEIGTDYNLPSATKFTVGTSSSLAAKNDSAFSGGSKKQVQVVSKNDVAKLRTDLSKSLEAKGHSEIANKVSGNEKVLPLLLTVSLDNQKLDKDIDTEAKKVKLTADVKFSGMAYQENEIIDYSKSLLKSKYSQDISFADNSIKNEIKDAKERKDKQIEATLVVTAGLLPSINTEELIKKTKDKSFNETKEMLSGQPQVVNTQINFSPPVFFLPNLFPRLPNQISVEVKPE